MRTPWTLMIGVMLWAMAAQPAPAHREVFTPADKDRMKAAEALALDVVVLTTQGVADATGFRHVAAGRLSTLGYRIVNDPAESHDISVKIKCEERKTWEGTVVSGGDADRLDAAARLWKGPACQISYRVGAQPADWRHEIRGGAAPLDRESTGAASLADLTARLAADPFPFLLAAAWGHTTRLLAALDDAATPAAQRAAILPLLGEMAAVDAIPALSRHLTDGDPLLAQQAAVALGAIGHEDCIPILLELLTRKNNETRLAAVKGLGRLAPLHPNSPIVPALIAQLPKEPVATQTEIVRALGHTTDRRILDPLRALNRMVQDETRSDSSPEWHELKRALGQSLDQFDGTHTEE